MVLSTVMSKHVWWFYLPGGFIMVQSIPSLWKVFPQPCLTPVDEQNEGRTIETLKRPPSGRGLNKVVLIVHQFGFSLPLMCTINILTSESKWPLKFFSPLTYSSQWMVWLRLVTLVSWLLQKNSVKRNMLKWRIGDVAYIDTLLKSEQRCTWVLNRYYSQ